MIDNSDVNLRQKCGVLVVITAVLAMIAASMVATSLMKPGYSYSKYDITIDCVVPDVPESVPTLMTIHVPVDREAAEAIAMDIFDFDEIRQAWDDDNRRLEFSDIGKSIVFEGLYDIYYDCRSKAALIDYDEAKAIEAAERIVDGLEAYWEMPTAVEHSLKGYGRDIDRFNRSLPVVGIMVNYGQSYHGIELGGGACFSISIADGAAIYANIRKPVVEVEGSDPITVTPMEAVKKALSRESAKRDLGVDDRTFRPTEGKANITKIQLIYYFDDTGRTDYLIPVYYVEGEIEGPGQDPGYTTTVTMREVVFATGRKPD